eukprot:Plantae.Rhodophyta-Hildenbrandia_rubra.ctg8021.p1 GENE.Plantae.Rhodophyta-Hildenbrandia_rubra.ctg8021~~Plantae.Rhodophyta-Hildenbrandia_rubra.ctg8021.p1  ORF type:complete len:673 (-),score=106.99 Plantae.Rhodophyta-Hildenbrandia_rubra.ctg8021:1012-2907(-)
MAPNKGKAPKNKSKKFKEQQRRLAEERKKRAAENGVTNGSTNGHGPTMNGNGVAMNGRGTGTPDPDSLLGRELKEGFYSRTGPLAEMRERDTKDIRIPGVHLQIGKLEIIENGIISLTYGFKYGLVGRNGAGKSTLLKALATRQIPIPTTTNVIYVEQEMEGDDTAVLDAVLKSDRERHFLIEQEKRLLGLNTDRAGEELQQVYTRLAEMDSDGAETRAATILHGLGFDEEAMQRPTKEYSGGYRMRVSLAAALFCAPELLLLDEPTNHLDVVALTWLEEFLCTWEQTVVVVSHDRGFLNKVTTHTMHLHRRRLVYYGGNYDTFMKVRGEHQRHATATLDTQLKQQKHLKEFIGRFQHGHKKMARQAQARMKMLTKLEENMGEVDTDDPYLQLEFPAPEALPPPCITVNDVTFGYEEGKPLYKNVDFGVDMESRCAIIGENGAGKSTMLRLLNKEILPTDGWISAHPKLRIAKFSQHHVDMFDTEKSALEHMRSEWPDVPQQEFRRVLGQFGLSGPLAIMPIKLLSGGQKSRVGFADLAYRNPHIMLLDEPTNHLDLETIESLAWSLNRFEGGVVLVSHDERLISLVCDELWVVQKGKGGRPGKVSVFPGSFEEYKNRLTDEMIDLGLING